MSRNWTLLQQKTQLNMRHVCTSTEHEEPRIQFREAPINKEA
jgi:hypothetical protein